MALIKYPSQSALPPVGDPLDPAYELIQMGELPDGWIAVSLSSPSAGDFALLCPAAVPLEAVEASSCKRRFIPDDLFDQLIQS